MTDKVLNYVVHYDKSCYLEFGEKEGNYAPAFSMCILPASVTGHLKIEVDIEIDDNNKRCHRCCFYVNSELGLIEKFGNTLGKLVTGQIGTKVSLNSEI